MNTLEILENIKEDCLFKTDNDPTIRRVCDVVINEYKARTKPLNIDSVVGQGEQLKCDTCGGFHKKEFMQGKEGVNVVCNDCAF
jgi:hypothetical protein